MKRTIVSANPRTVADAGIYLEKFTNSYGVQFPNIQRDYAALRQIIEQCGCQSVLEIGTWHGYAALFMWLTPCVKSLAAIDICRNYHDPTGANYHQNLPEVEYGKYFRYTTPCKLIVGDINSHDWAGQKFDFVFIDGAHHVEQVRHDVALAHTLAVKAFACHDLENGNPGVDQFFLTEYDGPFFQVSGTSVAYVVK